jgi:hypothetical protein
MSILNAITSGAGGVALSGDTSGNLTIQSAGTNVATFDTGGNMYVGGSTANTSTKPIYSGTTAKAWVNFDGTTATIRASFNISSVSGAGGNYTVNMTNALTDANYCAVGGAGISSQGTSLKVTNGSWTSSQFTCDTATYNNNWTAAQMVSIAVFR